MKKLLLLTVIISLATLAGFYGGRKVCMLMWPATVNPSRSWTSELGLSDAQAKTLREKESSFRKKNDPLCMQICAKRWKLLNDMKASSVDREAVYRGIEEVGQLQILLEKEIAAHILNVKEDLSPAQSEAYLDKIHAQFKESLGSSEYGRFLAENQGSFKS